MRVGILGSGLMGGKLGTLFARAGHEVVFSYARSREKLRKLAVAHTSSGAEALASRVPKARIVSAFHTVPSEVLFGVFEARRKAARPGLVYSGDDSKGKKIAAELIRDVGFDPVDAGPLRIARYTEPFALLVAQLAYEGKGGPELAYRFERFGT